MAHRKLTLTLTGLYLLLWQVWAELEINMENSVKVFLNDAATIPCRYNLNEPDSLLTIEWFVKSVRSYNRAQIYYKNSTDVIVVQDTGFSGRIDISQFKEGTLLTINSIRVSDEQEYFCKVTVDGRSEEGSTRLLVFNTPSFPQTEVEPYASSLSQELEQIASCQVNDAYPVPKITWYKNNNPLTDIGENVDVRNSETQNPSGLYTLKSQLHLVVVKEDKDAVFYCEVTYSGPKGEKMMESNPFNITVHYPTTTVSVTQEFPKGLIIEGDRVEIRCLGNGNPQPDISFLKNNDIQTTDNSPVLVLENVTRLDSGTYQCNSLDMETLLEASGTLKLMVHYLDPVVIIPENPESLDEGQDLSLTCNALSSLSTQTLWSKDNVLLDNGHTLKLHNVSMDMAGTYVCEVVVAELPDLRQKNTVDIIVRGKPMIIDGVTVILGDDESFNVSCRAKGHPPPVIQWNISDEQTPLEEWQILTDDYILSIISISTKSDIVASCTAVNDLGADEASLHIKTSQLTQTTTSTTSTSTKGSNGVIIAVIIIFILLLAILGAVLYFLYKKGRIPCGRSGKQDLTKEKVSSDDIVVEMKNSKSEEAVLLQGVNGDKKISNDQ
ncbi:melanoma cell adhesion molecule b isoform X2 [Trichomycterus rosablanca]|uniref:melanoma cell adhesion molecule b isoform X2 n=1 Tax=Trichomycterus rosablanca TaxID=2290929 RepID=UPI002F35AA6D